MVSVIIPTFNREKTVIRALDSVVNQTYKDIEIIVIDDGSTDNSFNLISENFIDSKIRIVRLTKNMGASFARNVGIKASKGNYIAFMDSDDIWDLRKIETCINTLISHNVDVVFHGFKWVLPNGHYVNMPVDNLNNAKNRFFQELYRNCIGTPTLLGKKKVFETIQFDEKMPTNEDWDLGIRIVQYFTVYYIDEILLTAYVQSNGLTMNHKDSFRAFLIMMDKYGTIINKDAILSSRYYSLLGDAAERSNQEGKAYFEKSLKIKFSAKVFIQYLLSSLRLYALVLCFFKNLRSFTNRIEVLWLNVTIKKEK